jgi:hypothetical protein
VKKYKLLRGSELKLSAPHGAGTISATFKATGPDHYRVVEVSDSDMFKDGLAVAIADGTIVPLA